MLEIEKEVLDEEELAKSKTVVEEARRRVKECDDQLKEKKVAENKRKEDEEIKERVQKLQKLMEDARKKK